MQLPPKSQWDTLTEAQRDVVRRLDGGATYAEVAEDTGRTAAAVRGLVWKARQRATEADEDLAITSRSDRYSADGSHLGYSVSRRPPKPTLTAEIIRQAVADAGIVPVRATKPPKARSADRMDVQLYGDMHLGMLAHHEETGANWDTDISVATHNAAFVDLMDRRDGDHLTVVAIGDIMHANDHTSQTPRSRHILDTDTRFYRTLRAALEMFAGWALAARERYRTVRFELVKGNHDPEAALALALALQQRFADEPRVEVPYTPVEYHSLEWGACLLGFTHGHRRARKHLPLIYATQDAEAWGRTRWRHLYAGHIHSEHPSEERGVTVETLQTLAPQDAYAAQAGYLAQRSASMVVFDKQRGRRTRHYYTPE